MQSHPFNDHYEIDNILGKIDNFIQVEDISFDSSLSFIIQSSLIEFTDDLPNDTYNI